MTALSVVVPLFDEEANVAPLLAELRATLPAFAPDAEIVLVDDGSRDGTAAAAAALLAGSPPARLVRLARNAGQTSALDAGFAVARGALVATLDGDLQGDPRDLAALLVARAATGADLVFGRRVRRADGFVKLVSTRVANAVRNALTGEDVADTGCPLKLFTREAVVALRPYLRLSGMHRFLVTLARLEGLRTTEVPVAHRPRHAGRSKYGVRNRVFRALRDCLAVRWMQRRRARYDAVEAPAPGAPS